MFRCFRPHFHHLGSYWFVYALRNETSDCTIPYQLSNLTTYATEIEECVSSLIVLTNPDRNGVSNVFQAGQHGSEIVNDKRSRFINSMNRFLDALCVVLTTLPAIKQPPVTMLPTSYHELDSHFSNIAARSSSISARDITPRESNVTIRESVESKKAPETNCLVAIVKMRMYTP